MANHISAIKRHKQSEKQRIRNRAVKSALNTKIKKIKLNTSVENMRLGQSLFAAAACRGIMHKKTASRKISRLMKKLKPHA